MISLNGYAEHTQNVFALRDVNLNKMLVLSSTVMGIFMAIIAILWLSLMTKKYHRKNQPLPNIHVASGGLYVGTSTCSFLYAARSIYKETLL